MKYGVVLDAVDAMFEGSEESANVTVAPDGNIDGSMFCEFSGYDALDGETRTLAIDMID